MGTPVLLFFTLLATVTYGYPSGGPTSACSSLTPIHRENSPQRSKAPYVVTATKVGDKIRVTITSPVGEDFEGFMMQARYSKNKNRMAEGKFSYQNGVSQTIDCHGGRQNTLTHVSKNIKSQLVTDWTPSYNSNEDVIFRATVAKTFQYYWIEIDSATVRITNGGTGSKRQKQNREFNPAKMYDNCFVTKGCFGYPADCVRSKTCEVFLSYVDMGDGVRFTMAGSLGSSRKYMAAGLSMDRLMGDDFVTECFMENGKVMAQKSWNDGKSNRPLALIPSGMYDWKFKNGISSCSWVRPYISNEEGRTFDLTNATYYTLIATGPMSDGRVRFHDKSALSSRDSVNLTSYELIEGDGAHDAVKVHGAFMVTGWIALVSIAILMARHFKNEWEDKTICGVKIWFAVHRGLMLAALAFIVVAFIVIFVHKGGWNYQTRNPHAILGCIATALGLVQPIMAAFRPAPDDKKRPIFNWMHWIVGNCSQIIAIVAVFLSTSLQSSGLTESFYWVMGVFVIVHYFFHFLFQLQAWSIDKKKNNEISMQEMNSGRTTMSVHNDKGKSSLGSRFRILLLGVYAIFLTVLMIALYALIGSA